MSRAGIGLRPPQSADYVALAGWSTDAADFQRWAGPLQGFPFEPEALPAVLAPRPGGRSYILAERLPPGAALGFGQCWPMEQRPAWLQAGVPARSVHLGRIVLDPACRGRGLGRSLVELLAAEAASVLPAVEALTLRVYRANQAAGALYRRLGFEPVPDVAEGEVLFMCRRLWQAG